MNEELEIALASLIEKTLSGVDAVVGFGAEQLPDVIQQLLAWNFWMNASAAVLCPIITYAIVAVSVKIIKSRSIEMAKEYDLRFWWDSRGEVTGFSFTVFFITGMFGWMAPVTAVLCAMDAAKIAIAPKVWLLEYAANLVK